MKFVFYIFSALLIYSLITQADPEGDAIRMYEIIEPKISDHEWKNWVKEKVSESYEVQQRDTLWGISKLMFGNSFLWPKLWTINTNTIGNPHVLEPGYVLVFDPNSTNPVLMSQIDTSTNRDTPEWQKVNKDSFSLDFPKYVEQDTQVTSNGALAFEGRNFPLMLNYFIKTGHGNEEFIGRISSSNRDKILLDVNNAVGGLYDKHPTSGTISIARWEKDLENPSSVVFKIVAIANVTETKDGKFHANISQIFEPVKRGDYIFYNLPVNAHQIPSSGGGRQHTGKIVDQAGSGFGYFTKDTFVIINLGSIQGVQLGEILDVVGNDNLNPEAPFVYKRGSLKVVQVSESYSIAIILEAKQLIERNATVVPSTGAVIDTPSEPENEISTPDEELQPPPIDEDLKLDEKLDESASPEEEELLEEPAKEDDKKGDEEAIPSFDEGNELKEDELKALDPTTEAAPPTQPSPSTEPDLGVEEGSGLDPDSLDDLSEEEKEMLNGKEKPN